MPAVGSHVPQARNAGSWKNWSKFWAKDGGIWKRPVAVHVKSGGSWVKVWDERPVATNISTEIIDFGTGSYINTKTYTIAANGFDTSVYEDGVLANTVSADTSQTLSSTKVSGTSGDYPVITATNSSASITF